MPEELTGLVALLIIVYIIAEIIFNYLDMSIWD